MFRQKPKTPLIIDSDETFISKMKDDPQAKVIQPLVASSGGEAQRMIANPELHIAGIFINPLMKASIANVGALSVIKFAKMRRLSIPVYLLVDTKESVADLDLHKMGVKAVLEKSVSYKEILELVAPQVFSFDPTLSSSSGSADTLGQEVQAADPEFIPIIAKNFLSGSTSHFSVYVKTIAGRYLKLLHPGDSFDPKRLASYLENDVQYFYIRKEDQEQYLKYSEQIASRLLVSKTAPVSIQASQTTMNYCQETLKFLSQQGISETRLYHAANFAESIQEVAKKLSKTSDAVAALMKDIATYEHGVSIAMLTSMISLASGIESERAVQIVGVASLLHDIGLVGQEPGFEYLDLATMTEEQKRIYYEHPRKGAEVMAQIPETHTTVIQAIHHHHERRGKIFDVTQNRPKMLSRIGEIIGLADEYMKAIHRSKTDPSIDLKRYMEKEVYLGFSIDTTDAFDLAFFPSRRAKMVG